MRTLNHQVDLCVVGGGLAGLCAAVSAARHGIKVAIMQDRPVFGGNSSSEIRMWVCGARGKDNRETGIIEEMILDNHYRNTSLSFSIWDSVLYEKALLEENLQVIMNCSCLDAEMDGKGLADDDPNLSHCESNLLCRLFRRLYFSAVIWRRAYLRTGSKARL